MEWTIRGALAVVMALLGYMAVAQALGYALRGGNPEQAHRLAPGDGRITALMAQRRSGAEATLADRDRADELARLALRQEPTAVLAASTLGLNAQVRGDTAGARRLFAYAQNLSRRDLQTQLWAIEDAVARDDVPAALQHYDIALRTSRDAPDLLYPVLGAAIADPTVRTALAQMLAGRPVWRGGFIDYVSGNGPNPLATVHLFLDLRRAGVAIPPSAGTTIVSTLMGRGMMEAAWAYYTSTHDGTDRNTSRDPDFRAQPETPSPFDWILVNQGGVIASFQRGGGGSVVDFAAPSGIGGAVLEQMQMLPPGEYRLDGQSAGIDRQQDASPYWTLTCRNGSELGRIDLPDTPRTQRFGGRFLVPLGCPVQVLALTLRPSDTVSGVSGQIHRAYLSPLR